MLSGVSMPAPETVFFYHDTVVENDVAIEPNVVFGADVAIRSGAVIRAFSHLEGALIEQGVSVGPYARLRPGTHMLAGSKVGNFCEIKKSVIAEDPEFYFHTARPPLLKDFFDPKIRKVLQVYKRTRMIEVNFEVQDHVVPDATGHYNGDTLREAGLDTPGV